MRATVQEDELDVLVDIAICGYRDTLSYGEIANRLIEPIIKIINRNFDALRKEMKGDTKLDSETQKLVQVYTQAMKVLPWGKTDEEKRATGLLAVAQYVRANPPAPELTDEQKVEKLAERLWNILRERAGFLGKFSELHAFDRANWCRIAEHILAVYPDAWEKL